MLSRLVFCRGERGAAREFGFGRGDCAGAGEIKEEVSGVFCGEKAFPSTEPEEVVGVIGLLGKSGEWDFPLFGSGKEGEGFVVEVEKFFFGSGFGDEEGAFAGRKFGEEGGAGGVSGEFAPSVCGEGGGDAGMQGGERNLFVGGEVAWGFGFGPFVEPAVPGEKNGGGGGGVFEFGCFEDEVVGEVVTAARVVEAGIYDTGEDVVTGVADGEDVVGIDDGVEGVSVNGEVLVMIGAEAFDEGEDAFADVSVAGDSAITGTSGIETTGNTGEDELTGHVRWKF
jgi:hypothetical protein